MVPTSRNETSQVSDIVRNVLETTEPNRQIIVDSAEEDQRDSESNAFIYRKDSNVNAKVSRAFQTASMANSEIKRDSKEKSFVKMYERDGSFSGNSSGASVSSTDKFPFQDHTGLGTANTVDLSQLHIVIGGIVNQMESIDSTWSEKEAHLWEAIRHLRKENECLRERCLALEYFSNHRREEKK